jgi:hypothetical protein
MGNAPCWVLSKGILREHRANNFSTFIGLWLSVVVAPNTPVPPAPNPVVVPNKLMIGGVYNDLNKGTKLGTLNSNSSNPCS